MNEPSTCPHEWVGSTTEDGYTCRLCPATGHTSDDGSEIIMDAVTPPPAPTQ